jgi:nicotinate-nucleotide adenylyltransferase
MGSVTSGGHARVGVLGGTFDPPHIAHLAMGAAAKHTLDLERVVFVPAGDPWRKAGREITAPDVRVRMLRAAVEPLSWAEVSTIEVEREGPSYLSETLTILAQGEPGPTAWWFILGDDALEDMPHWHEPDRIIELAHLALVWRPPVPSELPEAVRARFPHIDDRIDVVPMSPLLVSATDIRARIAEGRNTEFLLPEAVRAIVDDLGLYRGPA